MRIFFFDLDQTLLDHKTWTIPASTVEALARLKRAGHLLYVNTSRSGNEMKNVTPLLAPLELDGMILSGGAHTVAGGRDVRLVYAADGPAARALESMDRQGLSVRWQTAESLYFHRRPPEETAGVLRALFGESPQVRPWDGSPLLRLVTYARPEQAARLRLTVPELRFMEQGHDVVYVTEAGVDKATAMLAEAYRLGFSREQTVAFGDGLNDCDMLACAGTGVAMGNAGQAVKDHADYVTAPVDRDGILAACRSLGFLDAGRETA